jgi:hypothetical protein
MIEAYLVKRVKFYRGEIRKVKWIGRHSAPDRMVLLPAVDTLGPAGVLPAKQIWVELKATGKKPTPAQVREHDRMRAFGLHVEVVDSFERVDEILR